MTLFVHEWKRNRKSLAVWTLCVAGICFGCILLYTSLEESVQEVADSFANMGSMSAALGMDKMSIATLQGYYASEIALMHGIGGAMFAAILGTGLLSKEESGHTSEFLNTLPVGRGSIVLQKYLALLCCIAVFNVISTAFYAAGFHILGETWTRQMLLYHLAAVLMQAEIGTICFLISACSRKNRLGTGLGITILLAALDMMCRILPAIDQLKYVTPFYYANAADIMSDGKIDAASAGIGVLLMLLSLWTACSVYCKKDFTA